MRRCRSGAQRLAGRSACTGKAKRAASAVPRGQRGGSRVLVWLLRAGEQRGLALAAAKRSELQARGRAGSVAGVARGGVRASARASVKRFSGLYFFLSGPTDEEVVSLARGCAR